MWADEDLAQLSEQERADLAERLLVLNGRSGSATTVDRAAAGLVAGDAADGGGADPLLPPAAERRRRWFLRLLVVACLVLIPWIVLLALRLPPHYEASHWDAAWAGFDVVLLFGLAATAWAVWRRRQVALLFMLVTATLLVTDAWFDVLTARDSRDQVLSIASALLLELPLAALLFAVTVRMVRLTLAAAHQAMGESGSDGPVPIWRARMLFLPSGVADRR